MKQEPLISRGLPVPAMEVERKLSDPSMFPELSKSIKGGLYSRGDPSFALHAKLFNGDVISRACMLVRPFDAEDVSQVVLFCNRHSLSLSVKAGGYGTHGQAVQGDVIIDVSLLNDINIENINDQGGFTSMKDMPSTKIAGKGREPNAGALDSDNRGPPALDILSHPLNKRRAIEAFGTNDSASQHWPTFQSLDLFAPPLASGSGPPPASERGGPQPAVRRRISSPGDSGFDYHPNLWAPPLGVSLASGCGQSSSLQRCSGSNSGGEEGAGSIGSRSDSDSSLPSRGNSATTALTSPDLEPAKAESQSDPFGYMASEDPPATEDLPLVSGTVSAASSQPFTQTGVPVSLSMDMVSPAGHYMPSRADPLSPHAYVTFGSGAKQKEVDTYTASHPLPATTPSGMSCFIPYHVPFAAHPVGSSVMLLGGFGFLSRLHGLSTDSLVEVEMVLADGSIVIVNEEDNTDLWWALRGAGPAFGIVTRYKAKAYPVPVVFAGNLLYKFRKSTAASLIKHFRDCVKNVPRELYANVILTAGPDGDALLAIQICYLGTQDKGIEFLQAITSWDGEQCLLNEVSEKSFLVQQDSLAQLINGKAGRKWFMRSDTLNTLSDDTIHETVMRFADTPIGCTWLFELSGGNVSDEHGGCFPASTRQATWTVAAFHQWELDVDDPRCVTSAEDWMGETLGPASAGGPFPSFFGIHESSKRIIGTFGDNWQRLCELKRKYDPNGLFQHNFWPLDKNDQPKTTLVPTHTEF